MICRYCMTGFKDGAQSAWSSSFNGPSPVTPRYLRS